MTELEVVGYIMSSREEGKCGRGGRWRGMKWEGGREGLLALSSLSFPLVQVSGLGVGDPNLEISS